MQNDVIISILNLQISKIVFPNILWEIVDLNGGHKCRESEDSRVVTYCAVAVEGALRIYQQYDHLQHTFIVK